MGVGVTAAPRISVIVPVYRAQEYLADCVNSLLAQTFQDFELLLVDDGSPDECPRLCEAFAQKDSRVRVLHQENQGVSAARNTGIETARGAFLAFVDADDWVEPAFLQRLYACIGDAQIALCGVADGAPFSPPAERFTRSEMRLRPSRYAQLAYTNYAINKLYRRELLLPTGPRFDPAMRRGEDAAFVAACLQKCDAFAACPELLYHYRANDDSATHRFYTGICRDESKLWQLQKPLFAPQEMAADERLWYDRWAYGKIIAVLRYIAQYAPNAAVRRQYIAEFLADAERQERFTRLPTGIGGRSKLYAELAKHGWYGALGAWLKRLG